MPNHVETKMWLLSQDGSQLSSKQVEDFFSQFISIDTHARDCEEARIFDFNLIIPQPDNIWPGNVGGLPENNILNIEKYGGIDAVKKAIKDRAYFEPNDLCLTEDQVKQFGLVNGLDWNRKYWETKWGAYDCHFDWDGDKGDAHVYFYTAWTVPEKIIRLIREIALKQGFDVRCEFGGELDDLGVYEDGLFMYWETEWNDATGDYERKGDPVDVHK